MAAVKHRRTFGDRREPHTIIIARGEQVRYFTIGRKALMLGAAVAALVAVTCVAIPSYYLLQEDLAVRYAERQWKVTRDYEQRIAALRAQLDTATSRQFLSEKMVETKVEVLLDQQEELTARYDKLQPLLERAKETGIIATAVPLPTHNPRSAATDDSPAPIDTALDVPVDPVEDDAPAVDAIRTSAIDTAAWRMTSKTPMVAGMHGGPRFDVSEAAIRDIGRSIDLAELRQIEDLQSLAAKARTRSVRIASALTAIGIDLPPASASSAVGGPYEPAHVDYDFEESYAELDAALDALKTLHDVATRLPLTEPMPASTRSSTFGIRKDPFLGKRALHAGIDYARPSGSAVSAVAPGTVVRAGRAGGYGNMVEIDHGNGITTRYGHLSRIDVTVGQEIVRGIRIGAVGSTGRSTGPHLHYEVRRDGQAVDPMRFLRIRDRIRLPS
ncbi:M23 family metallopeptidase [Aurantimonas sp. A2-1-M11]|uniref:M23 family metallopeptidase n=1 Tax=Aurantimonas sp. A2-1-M11 TaxID=3113712 RepID=UPI002F95C964